MGKSDEPGWVQPDSDQIELVGMGAEAPTHVELADHLLGRLRVQFDLVLGGSYLGLIDKTFEMLDLEVGDTDRTNPSVDQELFQRLPAFDILVEHRKWPMDQEEIQDVDAQPLQTGVEGSQRPIVSMLTVDELRGDENLLARHF